MLSRTIVAGDAVAFAFATWLVVAVVIIGVALLAFGVWAFRRRKHPWFAGVAVVLGPVCFALIAPMMSMDRVTVDARGIHQTSGTPWDRRTISFAFDELASVKIQSESWQILQKDGQVMTFEPGDLWALNSRAIAELLRQRGVTVV